MDDNYINYIIFLLSSNEELLNDPSLHGEIESSFGKDIFQNILGSAISLFRETVDKNNHSGTRFLLSRTIDLTGKDMETDLLIRQLCRNAQQFDPSLEMERVKFVDEDSKASQVCHVGGYNTSIISQSQYSQYLLSALDDLEHGGEKKLFSVPSLFPLPPTEKEEKEMKMKKVMEMKELADPDCYDVDDVVDVTDKYNVGNKRKIIQPSLCSSMLTSSTTSTYYLPFFSWGNFSKQFHEKEKEKEKEEMEQREYERGQMHKRNIQKYLSIFACDKFNEDRLLRKKENEAETIQAKLEGQVGREEKQEEEEEENVMNLGDDDGEPRQKKVAVKIEYE
jgi:hypothetical protein